MKELERLRNCARCVIEGMTEEELRGFCNSGKQKEHTIYNQNKELTKKNFQKVIEGNAKSTLKSKPKENLVIETPDGVVVVDQNHPQYDKLKKTYQ